MPRKSVLAICTLMALSAMAASPLTPIKKLTNTNPIVPYAYCADPTAVEHEGRLYVYATNDQQQFDTNKGADTNNYGAIKSLLVLSTTDMVNWTWHGTINMAEVCNGWLANSWAPSIVSRVEDDGLTHFYMYFSNSAGGVGVVTSTSPLGPWKAPLKRNLVSGSTPGLGQVSWIFDPGAVIDDNGDGWLAFGGGDPNSKGSKLMPGNTRIVKLGRDMISFASDIKTIPTPYHFEASELNIMDGQYVYSYCTSWSDRNDWSSKYTGASPSTCSICYMTTDTPLEPGSWQYRNEMLKNPGAYGYPYGNNHCHLHKYMGNYYMIYHTQGLERSNGFSGGYRSLNVNMADVDESKASISMINANDKGVEQIEQNRPLMDQVQQAEMMWNGRGITMRTTGVAENCIIHEIEEMGWVAVKGAYADREMRSFTAKLRGTGTLEVRVGSLMSRAIATIDFASAGMGFKDYSVNLDKPIVGANDIYFVFTRSEKLAGFDQWQFSDTEISGIADIDSDQQVVSREYYDMTGIKLDSAPQGVYILRTTYADGHTLTQKISNR